MLKYMQRIKSAGCIAGLGVLFLSLGCQTSSGRGGHQGIFALGKSEGPGVRGVKCLYEIRPWLNLDAAGDRDPEGIRYRVFLDTGNGKGQHRDGMFHIEMYRIDRVGPREIKRTLVSDWHYESSEMPRIAKPGLCGDGYFFHLAWSDKSIAGREIEIITSFEDPQGRKARSGTKRFRVPKYTT